MVFKLVQLALLGLLIAGCGTPFEERDKTYYKANPEDIEADTEACRADSENWGSFEQNMPKTCKELRTYLKEAKEEARLAKIKEEEASLSVLDLASLHAVKQSCANGSFQNRRSERCVALKNVWPGVFDMAKVRIVGDLASLASDKFLALQSNCGSEESISEPSAEEVQCAAYKELYTTKFEAEVRRLIDNLTPMDDVRFLALESSCGSEEVLPDSSLKEAQCSAYEELYPKKFKAEVQRLVSSQSLEEMHEARKGCDYTTWSEVRCKLSKEVIELGKEQFEAKWRATPSLLAKEVEKCQRFIDSQRTKPHFMVDAWRFLRAYPHCGTVNNYAARILNEKLRWAPPFRRSNG